MPSRITFNEAVERFKQANKVDVQLIEKYYYGFKTKSKLWDVVEQDYFLGMPYLVLKKDSVHPNRRANKKQETCLKRYGYTNHNKSPEIQRRKNETLEKKYGIKGLTNVSQVPSIQNKTKQTNLKKYGKESFLGSEDWRKKTVQSNLERYGKEWFTQTDESQTEIKRKLLQNYGVEYAVQSPEIKEKREQTCIEKYGFKSWRSTQKKRIKETGQWLDEFLQKETKKTPHLTDVNKRFSGVVDIPAGELQDYLEEYRGNKSF